MMTARCRSSPSRTWPSTSSSFRSASVDELDELLTDLLVQVYPTKSTQDS